MRMRGGFVQITSNHQDFSLSPFPCARNPDGQICTQSREATVDAPDEKYRLIYTQSSSSEKHRHVLVLSKVAI